MGARSLASGGRASPIDVKSLGMACDQTSSGPTSLAPWPSAASGGLGRRREPRPPDAEIAQPLLEARPGPRLELGVRRTARSTGRLGVLEPGVGLLDQQQLVRLRCHGQPTRSPSSRRVIQSLGPTSDGGPCPERAPRRRHRPVEPLARRLADGLRPARRRRRPSSASRRTGRPGGAPGRARGSRSRRRRRRAASGRRETSTGRPWASAIRSTSRIWFSVSTGRSTPGTKTAAPISPFLRATRRISSSTTASRSTGSRAASPDARSPSGVGERLGDLVDREAAAGREAHEVGVEHVREALALGHADDRHRRAPRPGAGRRRPASPIQTSARRPRAAPARGPRAASPPARSSLASSGTSARAPATTSGRSIRRQQARLAGTCEGAERDPLRPDQRQ